MDLSYLTFSLTSPSGRFFKSLMQADEARSEPRPLVPTCDSKRRRYSPFGQVQMAAPLATAPFGLPVWAWLAL